MLIILNCDKDRIFIQMENEELIIKSTFRKKNNHSSMQEKIYNHKA